MERENEEAKTNNENGAERKEGDEYGEGERSGELEKMIWDKLCEDINQVPPCLNIKEVELMYGCDTQKAGLEMVHALRTKEKRQAMGVPQRAGIWIEAKGKGKTGRTKNGSYHRVAEEGGGVMKEKTGRKKSAKSKAPLTTKEVFI